MDCQKVGSLIYKLRKEKGFTQKAIAEEMNISDKTISKWERGLGCPDISVLCKLSRILRVNIEELLVGEINQNDSVGGNMKKVKFYVCPQCNNLMTMTGEAALSCCGRKLEPLEARKVEESHQLIAEAVEDELFIHTAHEMTKAHYLSFIAFATGDQLLITKQYPEWNVQLRLPKRKHGLVYFYCTQHGLFYQTI